MKRIQQYEQEFLLKHQFLEVFHRPKYHGRLGKIPSMVNPANDGIQARNNWLSHNLQNHFNF